MQTLPFSEFLDALRDKDFGVGLHEYAAVGKLLQHWDETNRDELRNSLAALIARHADEVQAIRRLFDEFYPPVVPELAPAPPPRRFWLVRLADSRVFWALAFAAVALGAALWLTVEAAERDRPPALPRSPLTKPEILTAFPTPRPELIAASFAESVAEPPAVGVPDAPSRLARLGLAVLATTAFVLAAVPLWAHRMRAATRQWTSHAWNAAIAALPGPFHGTPVLKDLLTRLPRQDIEEAATILGRSFRTPSTNPRGGRLDVVRSLRATLRAGMQPHLIFRPRRANQPILVLQDVCQAMDVHARRADGLCLDLGRQGIALERWFFDGDLGHAAARRHGPSVPLETLLRRRDDGPLMILGTGFGVAASLASGSPDWVTALRQQSRRVWVTPVSDPHLWPSALPRLPIPIVTMTRAGLLQAARWLTQDDRTAFRQVNRAPRPVTRAHVDQLRRLASLVPYPTVDLLELLRQRFAPEVPESAVLHAVGHQAANGDRPFRMADHEIRALVTDIRSEQPGLEARVRAYLLKVLADSEPPAGSAAHLRWQAARALQEVQLADIGGGSAAMSIATLRNLSQGPLWEEVRAMVARQPAGGASATSLRQTIRAEARTPQPPRFSESAAEAAVAPFRWSPPGWRIAGLASAVAGLAAVGGIWSGSFAIASANISNAYFIDYAESATGGPGVLRVRKNAASGDVPDEVQIYRGPSSVGRAVRLSGTAPVTVALDSGSGSSVYQARATLPTGALALSNTTWAPALLVVIDARPWAHVTMKSADAGVSPFTQTTPFSIRLPAGTYDLQLENAGLTGPRTALIVVAANGNREFEFAMPGFDLDQTLERLGVRPPARSAK